MGDAGFRAKVLARTTGPPCSNIVSFCVEGFLDTTYCAYALSDGAVLVQQVCCAHCVGGGKQEDGEARAA